MSYTKIAKPQTFEGAPRINFSGIYGASPKKEIIYRIPVLGERPLTFSAEGLPAGLTLDAKGVFRGCVEAEGNYAVTVTVKNRLGSDTKTLTFEIAPNHIALTPVLGYGSWNSFNEAVTQTDMEGIARLFDAEGFAEYGYSYMNIDSAWQGSYGGKFYAVQPNKKFPNIKAYVDLCHELGLKAGIYSSPYKWCWGGTGLPGCSKGETDKRILDLNGGVGMERYEQNNVDQWVDWGFDYLKYDWNFVDVPTSKVMEECLANAKRDMVYSVTVDAHYRDAAFWSQHCNMWRNNPDSDDEWDVLMSSMDICDKWSKWSNKGHYFDLDVLEVINVRGHECRFTEDEQIFSYSFRAIFPSPILVGNKMDNLSEFGRSLLCNEEILAVNQDSACLPAFLYRECKESDSAETGKYIRVYKKPLADGGYALGIFNAGSTEDDFTVTLEAGQTVRDLWAKEDLPASSSLTIHTVPHSARMLKIK